MVTAGYDTSNLVALYKDGKQCTSCCNIGDPCTHCDVTTPKTIFVELSGVTDNDEGVCKCIVIGGSDLSSKYEGMAADDVINNVILELTQSSFCEWATILELDFATLKTWGPDCDFYGPDCTGEFYDTRKICHLLVTITRLAETIALNIISIGSEDPGVSCNNAWETMAFEYINCDGPSCLCCNKEGGSSIRYWDLTNATIRVWSAFCPTMHVNDVAAQANAAGCGGDEEKIQVDVTVHDSDDAVLENAHVEITLTGAVSDVVYAETDAFGIATYLSDCLCINGTINVEVTNITKGAYIWDSDDDEDSLTASIVMDCV